MKEIFKSMWITSPLKIIYDNSAYLLKAFQLWCVNLSFYFTISITSFLFYILGGSGNFFIGVWEFTKAYFYSGNFMGFSAWRIHLTLYVFCLFIVLENKYGKD